MWGGVWDDVGRGTACGGGEGWRDFHLGGGGGGGGGGGM